MTYYVVVKSGIPLAVSKYEGIAVGWAKEWSTREAVAEVIAVTPNQQELPLCGTPSAAQSKP